MLTPRILARDELLKALQKCVEILLPGKTEELRDALKQLQDHKERLEQLDGEHCCNQHPDHNSDNLFFNPDCSVLSAWGDQ